LTKRGGVTAILGTDTYLAEAALEKALEAAVGNDKGAVQVVRGDETSWDRVLDSAGMRSLFSEERALVVRGAEGLKGDGEGVATYLEDPTPGVSLILLAGKPDRRKTVWKKIVDEAGVISADPLRGARLRSFVADELRRRRVKVAPEALSELVDRVGGDLRRLMGEVEKLEAFAAGREISAEDVALVSGRGLGRPLYVLADAFAERNRARALEEVDAALEDGERPELVLAALHRSLRQVRGTRQMAEERSPRDAMVRRLGLPPNMAFKVPTLVESAARWSDDDLASALRALGLADRAVKTGADAGAALVSAVAAACRRSGRPVRPAPSPRPRGR
jgi:DNA polymerase-3 subunit delta